MEISPPAERIIKRWRVASLLGGSIVLLAGCTGRPSRVDQPAYPSRAGAAAMDRYDADGDGAIAGAELDRVPALRASLNEVDSDDDGRVTAQEIDARVQAWRDSRTGLVPVTCQVVLDGTPLSGAQVTLDPEPFLGSKLKPASGTTGPQGSAAVSLAAEHLPDARYAGVACGWYKIRVTSNDREIPARYNTETTLGCEVAANAGWMYEPGMVSIDLESK